MWNKFNRNALRGQLEIQIQSQAKTKADYHQEAGSIDLPNSQLALAAGDRNWQPHPPALQLIVWCL